MGVCNIKISAAVHGYAAWTTQTGTHSRPAVAGVSIAAVAGHRCDHARAGRDLADPMVRLFGDIDITAAVHRETLRSHTGNGGEPSVAAETATGEATAGHAGDQDSDASRQLVHGIRGRVVDIAIGRCG